MNETITQMRELLGKMEQLLIDPQPGLHTWQIMVREVGIAIKAKSEEF